MKLPLKWKGHKDLEPQRQFSGDAGFDLVISHDWFVAAHDQADVPCEVSIELPPGVWGLIIARSSTLRRLGLLVLPGVVDNGWRGPLNQLVFNPTDRGCQLERGDRVAQLIPLPLTAMMLELEHVEELSQSDRGTNGFGSTGP